MSLTCSRENKIKEITTCYLHAIYSPGNVVDPRLDVMKIETTVYVEEYMDMDLYVYL